MSDPVRITERFAAPFSGVKADAVNEEAGTIDGVLLCGLASDNGRDYPTEVNRAATTKYEGAKVYFDHSDEKGRKFRDWVGIVRSPALDSESKNRGRLELFTKDPQVPKLLQAAKMCPDKFGMSHVALIKANRSANGRERVESIEQIESVDIVLDPATTRGLFESRGNPVLVPVKFAQLVETITRHPKFNTAQIAKAKLIAEDMGAAGYGESTALPDAPGDEADSSGIITAAIESAIMAIVKEALGKGMDKKEVLKTIGKFIDAHNDAQGTSESTVKPQQTTPDSWVVLEECKKAGLKAPTTSQLKVLAKMLDSKERAEFIAEIKDAMKGGAETPVSGSREQIQEEAHKAGKVQEQKELDEAKGANGKQRVTWD